MNLSSILLESAPAQTAQSGGSGLGLWIGLAVGVIAVLYVIGTYNKLVRKREGVKTAWSDIDTQLQRRYDLIPNLVEIAKGYLKHESEVLTQVTEARAGASQALSGAKAGPTEALMAAEATLAGAMGKFTLAVEAYPDLKGNSNMMQLSEEVTATENKVSFARQYYNDSVQGYNVVVQSFPANIFAGMFNFEKANFFEVENREEVSKAPKISF